MNIRSKQSAMPNRAYLGTAADIIPLGEAQLALKRNRRNAEDAAHAQAAPVSEALLLRSAIACFMEKGFHGTSMRDIASRAGTSVSHTYYYFPSKHHILALVMSNITQELIDALQNAADKAGADPANRLADVVRAHVMLHTHRQEESFIGNTELRSLQVEDRLRVIALRDRVSAIFKAAINDGLKAGVFTCSEPAEVTLAIVTMCTAVADWYRTDGPTTPEVMANRFAAIAMRMVGYRGAI